MIEIGPEITIMLILKMLKNIFYISAYVAQPATDGKHIYRLDAHM